MRGVRRSARGESSRKACREVEPFTLCDEMSHLTRTVSEPCHRTRGAASARRQRPFSTFELVSARESGRAGGAGFSPADRAYLGRQHIPTKGPWGVDDVDSEAYVSQFSADGSLLIAGFRGSRIKVYDAEKGWKIHKDISCRSVHWTVSDIALSPDQRFLAYASLSPIVHIVNVQSAGKESHANVTEIHEGLDLTGGDVDQDFGIFSVKFSKDGREVVVGNNESSIHVYDLAANKVSARIRAHTADVNAVTFADESGNVLYSGSDDSLCKVWDRRCLAGERSKSSMAGDSEDSKFRLRCRFSSRLAHDFLISLSQEQKMVVNEIGFGSVFSFPCFKLINRRLYTWLLSLVDTESMVLKIDPNIQIPITAASVHRFLGLPTGDLSVTGTSVIDSAVCSFKVADVMGLTHTSNLSWDICNDKIIEQTGKCQSNLEKERFVCCFIGNMVRYILAPRFKTDRVVSSILPLLTEPMSVGKFSWCQYVVDNICESTIKLKKSMVLGSKLINLFGCVLYLQGLYFDSLPFSRTKGLGVSNPAVIDYDQKATNEILKTTEQSLELHTI